MKSVLLDTSFILTCIRQKIDFFEDIKFMGFQIIIPKQVIHEIEGICQSKKKLRFREEAKLSLKLLGKSKFTTVDLKSKNTDNGILKYSKEHDVIVATLDRELKQKVKTSKLLIKQKKKLEVV